MGLSATFQEGEGLMGTMIYILKVLGALVLIAFLLSFLSGLIVAIVKLWRDMKTASGEEKFNKVFERLNKHTDGNLFQFQNDKFKLRSNGFVLFDEICQYFADEI